MSINSLPNEILEKIILNSVIYYNSKYYLKKYALVCRKWALIANHHLWKEVNLDPDHKYYKGNEFPFYRHITKPGYTFGKYILKLKLEFSHLWPICIIKILRLCPNIVDLTILCYRHNDNKGRGKVNNFLEEIQRLLPNLKRLNIRYSNRELTDIAIENLIENRKDLQILATRKCKKDSSHWSEEYNGKNWICNDCNTLTSFS